MAGMVTKVGRNVPRMLPMVFMAPRVPTIFPLSERESMVYLAREGVTVPSRNRGNTKSSRQVTMAAMIR